MANTLKLQDISPKALVYILFAGSLTALAYTIIFQKLLIATIIVCLPLAILTYIFSIRFPRFSFLIYATFTYYFAAIVRYSRKEGLSVISDALLVYMFLSILFYYSRKNSDIKISNAVNTLTVSYTLWFLFTILQFANPNFVGGEETIMTIRQWLLAMPMLYIIASLLADNPKMLKLSLIIIGIFTITAFLKLLYQKFRWFDAAETAWLMDGNFRTHLLNSGIRYFSLHSDAGNFGSHMGMITIVYSIVSFQTSSWKLSIFYFSVAVMGCIGMFMSGTRGAIIVPLGGLMLYCLICKSIKIMSISAIVGITLYTFFAFTNIGEGNDFIRRMRTAFQPNEDESFNVRKENQQRVINYLEYHPWGAGFAGKIPMTQVEQHSIIERTVPPDSYYVDIWIQTGYWGLSLYIAIFAIVLLRCCYIIMFHVKNKRLRNTLAALLCGVFGLWLNGYVGRGMGMTPSAFIIAASLAFILNGAYIDKQMRDNSL